MIKMKKILGALGATALLVAGNALAVPLSALPDISLLTPFAEFGNFLNDQNVTVKGNVGVANNGTLKLESPSTITGNVSLGIGATASGGGWPGNVTGTITTGVDFAAAAAQLQTASGILAALSPNVTLGAVTSGQTFGAVNGVADVFVVNVSSISLGSGDNISFTGDVGDLFVLNVSGDVDMGGDAAIAALSSASQVLFNLTTAGNLGNVAHIGNVINGTTLIPDASYAEFHSVNGAVWGGLGEIKLMSGAHVESVPFNPPSVPDAGSTLALMGIGLTMLAAAKRKLLA